MRTTHRIVCLLIVLLAVSVPAISQTTSQSTGQSTGQITEQTGAEVSVVENNLNTPQLVGKARLKFMLWKVFDAALYSETGQYDSNAPFALELTYLRSLKREKIVDKTMEEIRRLTSASISVGQLKDWRQQLNNMIPDVKIGMSITGIRTPEGYTDIYAGDVLKGSIEDKDFTDAFFAIWLGEDTAKPEFRAKLTGLEKAS